MVINIIIPYNRGSIYRREPIMANSDVRIPGNMKLSIKDKQAVGSAAVVYFGTHPQHRAAISVDKAGDTVKVDTKDDDGVKLTTLADADINWNNVSASNTTNYFSGDSYLITGVRLTSANMSGVTTSITQVNE